MKLPEKGLLLRIFIGEDDTYKGNSLCSTIVLKARELNLAGSTVLKGAMGFGANSRIHTANVLRLSEDLPLVIEIVDTEEKINQLLPFLDDVVEEGLITLEKVKVIKYSHRKK
jgi:PII-like signaling protein